MERIYEKIDMNRGQNQLFMLGICLIVIVFWEDLLDFQTFIRPDAFGIRIYIMDA